MVCSMESGNGGCAFLHAYIAWPKQTLQTRNKGQRKGNYRLAFANSVICGRIPSLILCRTINHFSPIAQGIHARTPRVNPWWLKRLRIGLPFLTRSRIIQRFPM